MTDNKIENKLLHYRTKAAFEADRKNIKDTSIAFVDEDLIIYTHGKYYSVGIDQKLAEVYLNVNEIIAEFESNINSAVDSFTHKMVTLSDTEYQELVSTGGIDNNTYYFVYSSEDYPETWTFGNKFPITFTEQWAFGGTFPITLN